MPDRNNLALKAVRRAERTEALLPAATRPRRLVAHGRTLMTPGIDPRRVSLIPRSAQGDWPADEVHVHSAKVAADVIVLAKFDLRAEVKLRAGYQRSRLTLAIQPGDANGGISRAVRAHEVVSAVDPDLVPPLRAHGRLDRRLAYLEEDWVDGSPLVGTGRLAVAAPHLLHRLGAVHRSYGLREVSVRDEWGEVFALRWARTAAAGLVQRRVEGRVSELLAQHHKTVAVSWSHGDLVASNVLEGPGGYRLVDWEHSGEAPVMIDAAKLHLFSRDPRRTVDDILRVWSRLPGTLEPAEQLLLAHGWLMSGSTRRLTVLRGHAREDVYRRQLARQADRMEQLVDVL